MLGDLAESSIELRESPSIISFDHRHYIQYPFNVLQIKKQISRPQSFMPILANKNAGQILLEKAIVVEIIKIHE